MPDLLLGHFSPAVPRSAAVQAEAMARAGIKADKFILLNVPDSILIER